MSISGNRKDRPAFDDADFLVTLAGSDGAPGPPSEVDVVELRGTTPVVALAEGGPGAPSDSANVTKKSASSKAGLSFRFPDIDKRFPPPSNADVEHMLKKLKETVVIRTTK